MTSSNNLCPLPPQIYGFSHEFPNANLQQNNQSSFMQRIEYDRAQAQYMGSFPNPYSSSNSFITNNNNINNSLMNSVVCSQSLPDLFDKHRHELDRYIHFQGEKLKEALHQQKNQQMSVILNNYQSKTMALLKQKEQDLENIRAKTRILEQNMMKKEEEIKVWQTIASEKNEMVFELNNMMNQKLCNLKNNYDNESVCDNYDDNPSKKKKKKNARGSGQNEEEEEKKYGCCKRCKCKQVCVVLLPCKHVCCCKDCEPFLHFCLVCQSLKQGCLEILIS